MQTLTGEKVLLELSKIDTSKWDESIRRICRDVARAIHVERVSVWIYNDICDQLTCECLYILTPDKFEKGIQLKASDYPAYFRALEENRAVVAHDALTDPATREFARGYLDALGVSSMLDVPVRLNGKVQGVVCHEHVGPQRRWQNSDVEFATMIATYVSLAYAASTRLAALSEIDRLAEENKSLKKRLYQ